jgi:hypothetical protein
VARPLTAARLVYCWRRRYVSRAEAVTALTRLAFEIVLAVDHPLLELHPELADCPRIDEVHERLVVLPRETRQGCRSSSTSTTCATPSHHSPLIAACR